MDQKGKRNYNKMKRKLDFLIIGAQKAGSTSLFEYIRYHPELYLPPEKEAPFFDSEVSYEQGIENYLNIYFSSAPVNKIWGKSTPNYMSEVIIPKRIYSTIPDVKIVAVLRNPIDRAYSHYKMIVRRGDENKSFNHAIAKLLKKNELEYSRNNSLPNNSYVIKGEYYRILKSYYDRFQKDQIAIYFFNDLIQYPLKVVQDIFSFLKVDSNYTPQNMSKVYNKGGFENKIPFTNSIKRSTAIKSLKTMVPVIYWRRIAYWFNQWNVKEGKNDLEHSSIGRELLSKHYEKEKADLSALIGKPIPW